MSTIKINIYRDGSTWFGARWIDGEYDGCDSLEVDNSATEAQAIEAAQTMPLTISGDRVVSRVDDIDTSR